MDLWGQEKKIVLEPLHSLHSSIADPNNLQKYMTMAFRHTQPSQGKKLSY